MKKLLFAGVLALFSIGASAATNYTLYDVRAYNGYAPDGATLNNSGGVPTSGSLVLQNDGTYTASAITFSFSSTNATFNYSNGSWSGSLTGTSITHSETCVDVGTMSSACTGVSGLAGQWTTGTANDGTADPGCTASIFFAAGNCNQITAIINDKRLTIVEQSEFALAGNPSGYVYNFTIPVPAAVWLFGSALGLLGWVRRRAA